MSAANRDESGMEDSGAYVSKAMIADRVGRAAASDGLLVERDGARYKEGTSLGAFLRNE